MTDQLDPPSSAARVLRVGPLMTELEHALRERYGALALPDDTEAFLGQHGDSIRVAVTSGRTGVPAELMDRLPSLEAIVNFGVGHDTTDVAAANARGIGLANTPDVLTDCVADTAVGLVIDVMRRLSHADRWVRSGRWGTPHGFPLTRRVSGARVGILGLGRIGTAIAHRLEAFGCSVGYHNRRRRDDVPYAFHDSALGLARSSDVLVIAASGGADSRGLVDHDVLDALGPDGYLVNVARGSIVDETALVEALSTGRLGGAGLDTFADEPHVPRALTGLDNVVLLPHLASGTLETRRAMMDLALLNVESLLEAGVLLTPVTSDGRRPG
jgi:lactate dehydrogenase-like 2-hydroxyacid dehydrogenase